MKRNITTCLLILALVGSASPLGAAVKPVSDFKLDQYLGVWYEIARIENSFEEGLTNVTATYQIRDDGKISVVNKGFEVEDNEWDVAESYGDFAETPNIGHVEVTFFWPFYVDYVVFEVDPDYQYAFVTSDSTDYLWLLAREPVVSQSVIDRFMKVAKEYNFKIEDLIFVPQEKNIKKFQDNLRLAIKKAEENDKNSTVASSDLDQLSEKRND